jgi:hypothetical protein
VRPRKYRIIGQSFFLTEHIVKKKEDLELVAEQMRRILRNPKSHPRDKVAAGKLLSQLELPRDDDDDDPCAAFDISNFLGAGR